MKKGTSLPRVAPMRARSAGARLRVWAWLRAMSAAAAFEDPPPRPAPTGMRLRRVRRVARGRRVWDSRAVMARKARSRSGGQSMGVGRGASSAKRRSREERSPGERGSTVRSSQRSMAAIHEAMGCQPGRCSDGPWGGPTESTRLSFAGAQSVTLGMVKGKRAGSGLVGARLVQAFGPRCR